MAGGVGPQPKQDEHQPYPVKDQLPNIAYFMTSSSLWLEPILLGFQHYLVMLGTTVLIPASLVPQMGGGNISLNELNAMRENPDTTVCCGFEHPYPIINWDSFTCGCQRIFHFVPTTISIFLAGRCSNIIDLHEKFERIIRGIQGALIVSSTLHIVFGFSGLWRDVTRFLSELSAIPLISLAGFGIYEFGFPAVA